MMKKTKNQIISSMLYFRISIIEIKSFMKKLLFSFWRLFSKSIYKLRKQIALLYALKVQLQNEYMPGERVLTVKEETLETMNFMKVYKHIEGGEIIFKHPEIVINRFSNALVFPSSDFIITDNIAVWPKSKYPHFQKITPLDKDLLKYSAGILHVNKPKSIIRIKCAFSLCGVHSKVWSHFMMQYLPKINYIDHLMKLSDNSLTLLTPEYNDHQIMEIINSLTRRYNKISVVALSDGQAAQCDILYHVENISIVSDHALYISPSDVLIPDIALCFLKEKFIFDPLLFHSNVDIVNTPYRKIFLSRKESTLSPLSTMRNLINHNEVESYFVNKGFEIIFPHEYDLSHKRKIFRESKIIVGPSSSGFTNIIFCHPGTKILVFGNYQRVYDLYISKLASYFDLELLSVIGEDEDSDNIHSSYTIPLNKIEKAYLELINS